MLAARHRARLAMQEKNVEVQEAKRRRDKVRRRLFSDADGEDDGKMQNGNHANTMRQFNEEYEEIRRKELEEAKKRWNFDFEKEVPLPGPYVWVKVDKNDNEEATMEQEIERESQAEKEENQSSEKTIENGCV